jgi:hypothetical protein
MAPPCSTNSTSCGWLASVYPQVQYMLTGSFALAYYATPRMTRDLDIVVQLREVDVEPL